MTFEQIYIRYFNDVYLYLYKLSGNEHIAEEIASETFFRAMRSIERFRGDCNLYVWLCQIAKNCYYTYCKKNARTINQETNGLEEMPDPSSSFVDRIIDHEDAKQIQSLLHTLPDPYKEVFMWRVLADMSFKQIGQLFEKNENWACVTYHRARNMLRSRLEDQNHE